MENEKWQELSSMHEEITAHGIQLFDTDYLEKYVELFTESLAGKSDIPPVPRPNNSLV
jgi:hypothetical protein